MKSNYEPIGKHIKFIANKNINNSLGNDDLKGINMVKEFFPSVANTIGVDLSKYKIVNKNQFAFNAIHVSRDELLPISLLRSDNPIIVSPAYSVFEIEDTNKLDPEYLMMWMRRSEFDRRCWFYTDTDIRGKLRTEDFCNIGIPIIDINEQREIVKQYNTIQNRIELKQKISQNLENMAQATFKSWFIDFEPVHELQKFQKGESNHKTKAEIAKSLYMTEETLNMFPNEFDENGLPLGWDNKGVGEICPIITGKRDANFATENGKYAFFTCSKETILCDEYECEGKAVLLAGNGDIATKFYNGKFNAYQRTYVLMPYEKKHHGVLYFATSSVISYLMSGARGSAIKFITKGNIEDISINLPNQEALHEKINIMIDKILQNEKEIQTLSKVKEVLLSKLTKTED